MTAFLVRRAAAFAATLICASLVIFLVLEVLPGNAAEAILGPEAPPEAVAALAKKLGVDRPPAARYLGWVEGMARGDFGTSYAYDTPAAALIGEALALTLPLALIAMALNTALGLALGIFAAARHNRFADVAVMALSQLGIAIPSFWFAILLILLFAVGLGWLPAGGFPGWGAGIWPGLRALILPAVSLAIVQAAILARITRSAVLDVLGEDFVRTARAKGLSAGEALRRHVLRNAMIPILTIMGLQFSNLLVLTIVVENVFSLPGLGRLILNAIGNRDIIVVRDVAMLLAAMVVAVNFVVDLLYAVIDPRLKLREL
ncbi:MAG TPA: ABC transporter permease [Stellaceae bacterium]|nr:ABC transporter permease [Stellaceae bacterium]